MKTLKDVKVGETATVARLHGEGPVKRRIMDMGITKGVQIYNIIKPHRFIFLTYLTKTYNHHDTSHK